MADQPRIPPRSIIALALLCSAGSACAAATAATPCQQSDDDGIWQVLHDCSLGADDQLQMSAQVHAQLRYDGDGLALLRAGGGLYYVHRDGRQLHTLIYDNGADYFADGLVRGLVAGKVGYFDAQLRPAFAQHYDFGFPFIDGIAEVCNGCREVRVDAEHHARTGGQWLRIDRHGRVLGSMPAR